MTLDTLKSQLAAAEQALEEAKALAYRCAGAVQILKQLLASEETPKATKTAPKVS